jgi:hypothetical protein
LCILGFRLELLSWNLQAHGNHSYKGTKLWYLGLILLRCKGTSVATVRCFWNTSTGGRMARAVVSVEFAPGWWRPVNRKCLRRKRMWRFWTWYPGVAWRGRENTREAVVMFRPIVQPTALRAHLVSVAAGVDLFCSETGLYWIFCTFVSAELR